MDLIRGQVGMFRIYSRFDAAPFSVVVSHFSPVGFDELHLCSRIRVRSMWSVVLELTPLSFETEYRTGFFRHSLREWFRHVAVRSGGSSDRSRSGVLWWNPDPKLESGFRPVTLLAQT